MSKIKFVDKYRGDFKNFAEFDIYFSSRNFYGDVRVLWTQLCLVGKVRLYSHKEK